MKKNLYDNTFILVAEKDETILLKDIKESIKALNILGKNDIKIFAEIHVDWEYSKIQEKDIPKYYTCYECKEISFIKGNKISYDNKFEFNVNKNKSFTDIDDIFVKWYINPILRIEIKF